MLLLQRQKGPLFHQTIHQCKYFELHDVRQLTVYQIHFLYHFKTNKDHRNTFPTRAVGKYNVLDCATDGILERISNAFFYIGC